MTGSRQTPSSPPAAPAHAGPARRRRAGRCRRRLRACSARWPRRSARCRRPASRSAPRPGRCRTISAWPARPPASCPASGLQPNGGEFRFADFLDAGRGMRGRRSGSAATCPPAPAPATRPPAAVAEVFPAIEIVEKRYDDLAELGTPTLIADQVFHAAGVLGAPAAGWRGARPRRDARADSSSTASCAARASGADLLGHPLEALAWLAGSGAARGLRRAAGGPGGLPRLRHAADLAGGRADGRRGRGGFRPARPARAALRADRTASQGRALTRLRAGCLGRHRADATLLRQNGARDGNAMRTADLEHPDRRPAARPVARGAAPRRGNPRRACRGCWRRKWSSGTLTRPRRPGCAPAVRRRGAGHQSGRLRAGRPCVSHADTAVTSSGRVICPAGAGSTIRPITHPAWRRATGRPAPPAATPP